MTPQDIIAEIKHGLFTNDDLNAISTAIQFARAQLAHEIKREIFPGARVSFRARNGATIHGTVDSVKIKNAIVSAGMTRYRVPCNMLEVV